MEATAESGSYNVADVIAHLNAVKMDKVGGGKEVVTMA